VINVSLAMEDIQRVKPTTVVGGPLPKKVSIEVYLGGKAT